MRNARRGSVRSRTDGDEPAFATDDMNVAMAGEASEEEILWAQVGRLGTADPRPIDLFRPSPHGPATGSETVQR
jgi:hypothetical protein